jgi:hypothetical protein
MTDQKNTFTVAEHSADQLGSAGSEMEVALSKLRRDLATHFAGNPAPWGTDVHLEFGDAYHDLAKSGLPALNSYVQQLLEAKSRLLRTVEHQDGTEKGGAQRLERVR